MVLVSESRGSSADKCTAFACTTADQSNNGNTLLHVSSNMNLFAVVTHLGGCELDLKKVRSALCFKDLPAARTHNCDPHLHAQSPCLTTAM